MMFKKYILLLLVLSFFLKGFSQKSINDYKYVVIPEEFKFLGEADKYQINSLTKFLFNKYGFEAYLSSDDYPSELNDNPCMSMYVDVMELKGFLTTKLQIELMDCKGDLITKSSIGKSKLKDFNKVYNVALRNAFKSIRALNYKYNSDGNSSAYIEKEETQLTNSVTETKGNNSEKANEEVKRLKKEIEDLKKQKEFNITESKKLENTPKLKVETPKIKKVTEANTRDILQTLYAQAIDEGYQLVNAEPRVVMILLKTSAPNVYLVKDKDAIVYKQNDKWMYSENDGANKSEKELNIKF